MTVKTNETAGYGEHVGLALETLRRFRGVSRDEICKGSGVSRSMLSHYERGKTIPSLETLDKMLAAVGADLATFHQYRQMVTLLRDEGSPTPRKPERTSETAFRNVVDSFHVFLRTLRAEMLYDGLHGARRGDCEPR